MKLSLNTYAICNDWSLAKIIDVAQHSGYDAIEFRIQVKQPHGVEIGMDDAAQQRVLEALAAANLEISCISSSINFSSADAAERAAQLETCKEIILLTQALNGHVIKVGANRVPEGASRDEFIDYVAATLREAGEFAAAHGVKVLLELHTPFFSLPENSLAVIEKSGTNGIGFIFNCEPEDIVDGSMAQAYNRVKEHVRHIHIHDLLNRKIYYPYEEFYSILQQDGYDDYLSVEISSHALGEGPNGEGVDGATAFAQIAERHRELVALPQ